MSQELQRRRRAIVTGLTPYMNEAVLMEAISHWQQHYSERPRYSLQGYVSDLCKLFDLGERRHHIHMSLVQAMSMSEQELAHDPMAAQTTSRQHSHPCTAAFQALMEALWEALPASVASQLRLDMIGMLRGRSVSPETRLTMEHWLHSPGRTLGGLPLEVLRKQLNNAYVLLCERLGPVEADTHLKSAYTRTRQHRDLEPSLKKLM
ncbi:hypothetical protein MWU49_01135 [Alcanivorax sp. S6407]|uniref:hypothetical protein n=1 Tax=Alcanivorax sp. S6407 TaxID=2926424 RepID=UPI001FF37E83|nr:hypothetical protein [Alcanivorax sp. S6407]MCK0152294.1 hypothetical protein [Alcanivorax sp. S6407]